MTPTSDLPEIFERLEGLLRRYAPPLAARTGSVRDERDVHLWSEKEVVVAGRTRREVHVAAAIVQKRYVGFCFMPVYTHAEQKDLFAPELLALLKGKSCFHIGRLEDEPLGHVSALERGFQLQGDRGWV